MVFSTVFFCVLTMLVYMACGFFTVKARVAVSAHAKSFSGFLLYICCPCMVLDAFQKMDYSIENFVKSMEFFAASFIIQILFFALLYFIFHKKYSDAKYRILTAGAILGNVGFFGLPLITAIFPGMPLVACYSMMYMLSMNILVFTLGVFLITKNRKFISVKSAIINPTTISVLVAIPLYLLRLRFPSAAGEVVSTLGSMTTPVCMVILGMRLASMNLKKVFCEMFAYAVGALKLIVFPLAVYAAVYFIPFFDSAFRVSLVALSSAPSAAFILTLAELHETEQEKCANIVLVTTIMSIVTLPLIMLVVR